MTDFLSGSSGSLASMQAQLRQALDPAAFAREVLRFPPDPWQERILRTAASQVLMCCSRQSGKSTVAAAAALHTSTFKPGSLVLMVAPTQRQSTELLAKASAFIRHIPAAKLDTASSIAIKFNDGGRLISLPGTDPDRIRGFSAPALVVIDEGAFVDDQLYYAIRPMLAVGGGRLLVMSTPRGKRGWFYDAWHYDSESDWHREKITAYEVPRISPAFLEAERRRLGDRWFRQEYLCEFISEEDELFDSEDVQRAINSDIPALKLVIGL
ncbi:MAG: terminase family protein [Acetobacteraceae bacterium]